MTYEDEDKVPYHTALFLAETVMAFNAILAHIQEHEPKALQRVPQELHNRAKARHAVLANISDEGLDLMKMPLSSLRYYAAREGMSLIDMKAPLEPQIKEILELFKERLIENGISDAAVELELARSLSKIRASLE